MHVQQIGSYVCKKSHFGLVGGSKAPIERWDQQVIWFKGLWMQQSSEASELIAAKAILIWPKLKILLAKHPRRN